MRRRALSLKYSGRWALLVLASSGALGCGKDCVDSFPPGTRFQVTVPDAFAGCHVTFDAGTQYDLVAGPAGVDEEGCAVNPAEGPPAFTTMAFAIGECRGDVAHMGVDCNTHGLDCPGDTASHSRWFYMDLPKEPGQTVSTALRMSFSSGNNGCLDSCGVDIPVTVRR